jgi:hypothetical protein
MSGRGLGGVLAALRDLLAGRKPRPGARPPAAAGPVTPPPGAGTAPTLPASWQLPERPSAQVSYKRDSWGLAPGARTPARERTIARQRLLVLAALATAAIVGAVHALGWFGDRTLPARVRGVWQTDGAGYEQRLFELAGNRLAFQVSDSAATIHRIARVHRRESEAGTLFEVTYRDDLGDRYEFSFVYWPGPPEEIRFAHQPFMVWTRVGDRRRLLPEVY